VQRGSFLVAGELSNGDPAIAPKTRPAEPNLRRGSAIVFETHRLAQASLQARRGITIDYSICRQHHYSSSPNEPPQQGI
jgi:hypothetical protein